MIRQQLFIGAALVVGVAIGYFVDSAGKAVPQQPTSDDTAPSTRASTTTIPDHGESATIQSLRARVAELEKALAQSKRAAPPDQLAAKQESRRPDRPFEDLKKTDPARYAQMTNRMATMRARHQARQQARMDFLSSLDTSLLNESGKKTHAKFQKLSQRREELSKAFGDESLTEDERRQLMEEMRENDKQLRHESRAERKNLFEATARSLGFSSDDAAEISETLQDVVEATESGSRGHPPPPPDAAGAANPPPPMP